MLLFLNILDTEEEKDKFVRIYEGYRYMMWYSANEILKDKELAEDAVQEAFLALTHHLDKVDESNEGRTKKFLRTIVKSKAIDIVRKRKEGEVPLQDAAEEYLLEAPTDILNEFIEKESVERIKEAVMKLEDTYRLVFEFKLVHQLSDKDIGNILGISAKTANVRYFRARKKLQEMLMEGV